MINSNNFHIADVQKNGLIVRVFDTHWIVNIEDTVRKFSQDDHRKRTLNKTVKEIRKRFDANNNRPTSLGDFDAIFVPYNLRDIHWAFIVAWATTANGQKTINWSNFDSLGLSTDCANNLTIQDSQKLEFRVKKWFDNVDGDNEYEYKRHDIKCKFPQQQNTFDCGIHVIQGIRYLSEAVSLCASSDAITNAITNFIFPYDSGDCQYFRRAAILEMHMASVQKQDEIYKGMLCLAHDVSQDAYSALDDSLKRKLNFDAGISDMPSSSIEDIVKNVLPVCKEFRDTDTPIEYYGLMAVPLRPDLQTIKDVYKNWGCTVSLFVHVLRAKRRGKKTNTEHWIWYVFPQPKWEGANEKTASIQLERWGDLETNFGKNPYYLYLLGLVLNSTHELSDDGITDWFPSADRQRVKAFKANAPKDFLQKAKDVYTLINRSNQSNAPAGPDDDDSSDTPPILAPYADELDAIYHQIMAYPQHVTLFFLRHKQLTECLEEGRKDEARDILKYMKTTLVDEATKNVIPEKGDKVYVVTDVPPDNACALHAVRHVCTTYRGMSEGIDKFYDMYKKAFTTKYGDNGIANYSLTQGKRTNSAKLPQTFEEYKQNYPNRHEYPNCMYNAAWIYNLMFPTDADVMKKENVAQKTLHFFFEDKSQTPPLAALEVSPTLTGPTAKDVAFVQIKRNHWTVATRQGYNRNAEQAGFQRERLSVASTSKHDKDYKHTIQRLKDKALKLNKAFNESQLSALQVAKTMHTLELQLNQTIPTILHCSQVVNVEIEELYAMFEQLRLLISHAETQTKCGTCSIKICAPGAWASESSEKCAKLITKKFEYRNFDKIHKDELSVLLGQPCALGVDIEKSSDGDMYNMRAMQPNKDADASNNLQAINMCVSAQLYSLENEDISYAFLGGFSYNGCDTIEEWKTVANAYKSALQNEFKNKFADITFRCTSYIEKAAFDEVFEVAPGLSTTPIPSSTGLTSSGTGSTTPKGGAAPTFPTRPRPAFTGPVLAYGQRNKVYTVDTYDGFCEYARELIRVFSGTLQTQWCNTYLDAFAPYYSSWGIDWKDIKESLFYACDNKVSPLKVISTVRVEYNFKKRQTPGLCANMYAGLSGGGALAPVSRRRAPAPSTTPPRTPPRTPPPTPSPKSSPKPPRSNAPSTSTTSPEPSSTGNRLASTVESSGKEVTYPKGTFTEKQANDFSLKYLKKNYAEPVWDDFLSVTKTCAEHKVTAEDAFKFLTVKEDNETNKSKCYQSLCFAEAIGSAELFQDPQKLGMNDVPITIWEKTSREKLIEVLNLLKHEDLFGNDFVLRNRLADRVLSALRQRSFNDEELIAACSSIVEKSAQDMIYANIVHNKHTISVAKGSPEFLPEKRIVVYKEIIGKLTYPEPLRVLSRKDENLIRGCSSSQKQITFDLASDLTTHYGIEYVYLVETTDCDATVSAALDAACADGANSIAFDCSFTKYTKFMDEVLQAIANWINNISNTHAIHIYVCCQGFNDWDRACNALQSAIKNLSSAPVTTPENFATMIGQNYADVIKEVKSDVNNMAPLTQTLMTAIAKNQATPDTAFEFVRNIAQELQSDELHTDKAEDIEQQFDHVYSLFCLVELLGTSALETLACDDRSINVRSNMSSDTVMQGIEVFKKAYNNNLGNCCILEKVILELRKLNYPNSLIANCLKILEEIKSVRVVVQKNGHTITFATGSIENAPTDRILLRSYEQIGMESPNSISFTPRTMLTDKDEADLCQSITNKNPSIVDTSKSTLFTKYGITHVHVIKEDLNAIPEAIAETLNAVPDAGTIAINCASCQTMKTTVMAISQWLDANKENKIHIYLCSLQPKDLTDAETIITGSAAAESAFCDY